VMLIKLLANIGAIAKVKSSSPGDAAAGNCLPKNQTSTIDLF
jgi:hypothetical protein